VFMFLLLPVFARLVAPVLDICTWWWWPVGLKRFGYHVIYSDGGLAWSLHSLVGPNSHECYRLPFPMPAVRCNPAKP
jgi:hypothetical protein